MSHPLFSLSGRRALVTGGSRGLGFAMATGLAEAGAEVILAARSRDALDAAAETLRAAGHAVGTVVLDVTDPAACDAALDRLEAEAPVDILFANAGLQHRGPLHEFAPEDFDRLLSVNVAGVFHAARAAARHMIARGRGKIVATASIQTALARPTIAPYTATKGAVANLVKGMAADWGPLGLQCNAIAPGYFDTPMNAALVADPEFTAWVTHRTPAGRWGKLDDLKGAAIFLASDASAYVNGQTLFVDGGMSVTL